MSESAAITLMLIVLNYLLFSEEQWAYQICHIWIHVALMHMWCILRPYNYLHNGYIELICCINYRPDDLPSLGAVNMNRPLCSCQSTCRNPWISVHHMDISKAAALALSDIIWGGGVDLHNATIQTHIYTAARVHSAPGETQTRQKDKTRCCARHVWMVGEHWAWVLS